MGKENDELLDLCKSFSDSSDSSDSSDRSSSPKSSFSRFGSRMISVFDLSFGHMSRHAVAEPEVLQCLCF
jgi:hypothetical protein